MKQSSLGRFVSAVRWSLAIGLFVYGLLSADSQSRKWAIGGILVFSLPLALQFTRWKIARTYANWAGLFLILQTLYPLYFPNHFFRMPSNYEMVIDTQKPEIGVIKVTTDAKGFRTTKPIDYEKKSAYRVFTIGASSTVLEYLGNESTWSALLQERLAQDLGRDVEVINAGLSGTRSENHLATLDHILRYKPDLVVFHLGINDWNRHIKKVYLPGQPPEVWGFAERTENRYSLKYSYLGTLVGAIRPPKVENPLALQTGGTEEAPTSGGSLFRPTRHRFMPTAVSQDFARNVEKITQRCRDKKITCVFLNQPTAYHPSAPESLQRKFWMTPPIADFTLDLASMQHIAELYNRYLVEFSSSPGPIGCDLAKKIPPTAEYFYDEVHTRPRAQAVIADTIVECLHQGRALSSVR